jgi:ABC-type antimicrobial peptide transport system permease subunit
MTFPRLLLKNLRYHWRGNCAVFLGVAVGTAVLTGALLVGDSLRGSLRDVALKQLGWVQHALVSGRFVSENLASELNTDAACPVLMLQGSARAVLLNAGADKQELLPRAGKVAVLGVDGRFWRKAADDKSAVPLGDAFWNSKQDAVVLNATLADQLGVRQGDAVALYLQKASNVPRESLLGRRDANEVVDELRLSVAAVVPDDSFGGRFNLNPSMTAPRNALVPLHTLQSRLGIAGRMNAILVGQAPESLAPSLAQHLTLDDWGLVLHTPEGRASDLFAKLDRNKDGKLQRNEWRGRVAESFAAAADQDHDGVLTRAEVDDYYRRRHPYLNLESRQMLLEPAVGDADEKAAQDAGLRAAPTLVYLANTIAAGQQEIPYSIVAALDPNLAPPLGPFQPTDQPLRDDEILLADWKESPLHPKPGDAITLKYFQPEDQGRLRELSAQFRLRGLVPIQDVANDPDLTPEFPGITDKLDIRDWNPPFPYDNKRIKKRDEDYWKQYRTTPKAYVTLAAGQRLWGSRFGQLTSIRLAPAAGGDPARAADDLRRHLLARLRPELGGLVFQPVREEALKASANGVDFGMLFLGFSFFLIVAALLLVGLLFRLNLDRRAAEIGLLLATGYRRQTVRKLLLSEGAILAAAGAVLGSGAALLFAWLMLEYLGPLDRSLLTLHVTAQSFVIGYVASLVVSVLTIIWAVRILGKVSPSGLLAGTVLPATDTAAKRPGRWGVRVAVAALLLGVGMLVWSAADPRLAGNHEMLASMFFGGGALLLTAGLLFVWAWMRAAQAGRRQKIIQPSGLTAKPIFLLGVRNATRYPLRSLLTAGLLASAAFILLAVDSFRRAPGQEMTGKDSPSGGFALVGESDVPVYQDLNTDKGQDELNFSDRVRQDLQGVTIYELRLRRGDDASCLNLYQPRRPRVLGVPHVLIDRGGFQFQATQARSAEQKANPWRLLEEPQDDGSVPVFGEANTVMWILKSGLGKELTLPNERGEPVRLKFIGLLQDSVFQSELLMSEANFLKLFPGQEGYNYFLIDVPPDRARALQPVLNAALADHGMDVTPTAERLAAYMAVENTYLSTFQALGGLGLLLGALGLAVVLLRNVWERRGELALLRALGYRRGTLGWLVLSENGFLLALGLGVGTVTALLSVAPHLRESGGDVPVLRLLALLALVLAIGLAAGAAAVVTTLRAPLLPALRRE